VKVNAVFEGGGVKGIAFVGAIEEIEKAGYTWHNLAGTSAGSIVATLLAAGFNAKEITNIFVQFPFDQVEKKQGISRVPVIGPLMSIHFNQGIYTPSIIEYWLNMQLAKKAIYTFGDLPPNKLKVIVTDITQYRMSVLPDDLPQYGIEPSTFPLSLAVRMSCSIPFIFRPCKLGQNVIVDGAVLSNYPIWLFDQKGVPKWPTFGFRLTGPKTAPPQKIKGSVDLAVALIKTMVEGNDNRYISSQNAVRTIFIDGIKVSATDFNLSNKEKQQLVQLGRDAALRFLAKWNFQQYIKDYRLTDMIF
jgi:NTE family protein